MIAALTSSYEAFFTRRHVKSTTETFGVGTRKAMPVSLPLSSGRTFPTAYIIKRKVRIDDAKYIKYMITDDKKGDIYKLPLLHLLNWELCSDQLHDLLSNLSLMGHQQSSVLLNQRRR